MSIDNKRVVFDPNRKSQSGGKNEEYYDGMRNVNSIGAGDSFYVRNFIKSSKLRDDMFGQLLDQVPFEQMFNFYNGVVEPIPRLVAAETDTGRSDNRRPIYRMPGCNERNIPTTDWTETVRQVVDLAGEEIGQPFN